MSKSAQQVLASVLGGPPQICGRVGSLAEGAKTEVLQEKSVLDDANFGWRAVAATRMLRGISMSLFDATWLVSRESISKGLKAQFRVFS